MKRNIFRTFGGLVLLALVPASAFAHTDVHVGVGLGVVAPEPYYVEPPPVYYEPPVRYYSPPPPVYYGPRVIYRDRDWYEAHQRWKERQHRGYRHHYEDD